MVTAKFDGSRVATVYGLTQWDYGQELAIEADCSIADGTEVQFYQNSLATTRYLRSGRVMIPDIMLQDDQTITAYAYVRTENAGETVLTAYLRITTREKPTDYVLPDTQEYQRLLPAGGELGQVIKKMSDTDFEVVWSDAADGMKVIDGCLQLMSGDREVGDRIRIDAISGREVELTSDGVNIKWRYTDSNEWTVLVSLESLKGPPGETPEFEIRNGHLYAIYKN